MREHRDVDMLLLMLESYFATLSAGEDVDDALLLDAMRYMTDFAGGFHHAKERLAIEAAAQRSTAIAAAKPELEAQYERIGEAGPWLCSTLELTLRDAPVPKRRLFRAGLSYTAEVRRNMALEEKVVFPALCDMLDAGTWRLLDAKI
jgi:hemerythrin-like domain-containing protein